VNALSVRKICSISVDLDEIHHYTAIHGVAPPNLNTHAVFDIAVRRLCDWADEFHFPLTLFTVGADLSRPENVRVLRYAVEKGHEIANHSLNHHYGLTRLSTNEMATEVGSATRAIYEAVGVRPTGFRAPGYTTSDTLYSVLAAEKYAYSSSVFPCPWYYAAKACAIGVKRLLGRRSASVVDTPSVLTAPTAPYRVGTPYWTKGNGVLELPIQTTPGLRVPYIGTFLTWGGMKFARWSTRQVSKKSFVNLELHGIDVLDRHDGLEPLVPHQYDVRIPTARKLEILTRVVLDLRERGFEFERLDGAAQSFARVGAA
jgi:peptidoglycan-N-acetylglucosamine deacetylase